MHLVKILEWACFSCSLLCVWSYGRGRYLGPVVGCCTAILFMAYGITGGVWAAAISNVFFLGLHARNYIKARNSDMDILRDKIKAGWNIIQSTSHGLAVEAGWWTDLETGKPKERNVGELLMLIVSEVAEGMEGHRKNKMDDKLPHRPMLEVELADAVIRIGDLAGKLGLDVGGAIAEKMAFNAIRPDHKLENRQLADGKKY